MVATAAVGEQFLASLRISRGHLRRRRQRPPVVMVGILVVDPAVPGRVYAVGSYFPIGLYRTAGFDRNYATLVNAPLASIPSNLLFVPGANPGSIIIGGGVITAQPSTVAAAPGNDISIGVRNYFTENDDVRWNHGKHSWSFGGWIQRIHIRIKMGAQGSAANVAYPTVLAFLQDKPSQATVVRNPVRLGYRMTEAAWYVQDAIRLRPNLTVRVGVRDEMTNGLNEVADRCVNYFYDPTYGIQVNPHVGGSCLQHNNALALWQPRIGIAWDPTGTGTWAVRAAFGIHNDLMENLAMRVYANPPYSACETLIAPGQPNNGFLSLLPIQKNVRFNPPAPLGRCSWGATSLAPVASIRTCLRPPSRCGPSR